MQALREYVVDRAVVPIENSIAGSLHSVYDLMLRYRVHIVGEVSLQVSRSLCQPLMLCILSVCWGELSASDRSGTT